MEGHKLARYLYKRFLEERSRVESARPVEYIPLEEALRPGAGVRLADGSFHQFSHDHVSRLYNDLPWYLRAFVKVPWVFVYQRRGGLPVAKLIGPDHWAARAAGFLLEGTVAVPRWELRLSELEELLSKYLSVIVVLLEASL